MSTQDYEHEVLSAQFNASEDEIWSLISRYFAESLLDIPRVAEVHDIRRKSSWRGATWNQITFDMDVRSQGTRVVLMRMADAQNPMSREESLLGHMDVRNPLMWNRGKARVSIVCNSKPFLGLFEDLANRLTTAYSAATTQNLSSTPTASAEAIPSDEQTKPSLRRILGGILPFLIALVVGISSIENPVQILFYGLGFSAFGILGILVLLVQRIREREWKLWLIPSISFLISGVVLSLIPIIYVRSQPILGTWLYTATPTLTATDTTSPPQELTETSALFETSTASAATQVSEVTQSAATATNYHSLTMTSEADLTATQEATDDLIGNDLNRGCIYSANWIPFAHFYPSGSPQTQPYLPEIDDPECPDSYDLLDYAFSKDPLAGIRITNTDDAGVWGIVSKNPVGQFKCISFDLRIDELLDQNYREQVNSPGLIEDTDPDAFASVSVGIVSTNQVSPFLDEDSVAITFQADAGSDPFYAYRVNEPPPQGIELDKYSGYPQYLHLLFTITQGQVVISAYQLEEDVPKEESFSETFTIKTPNQSRYFWIGFKVTAGGEVAATLSDVVFGSDVNGIDCE